MKATILFCIIMTTMFSQTEKENYKTASGLFLSHFNSADDDQIFNQFAAVLKKALPIETTRQFLSGIRSQSGKIKSMAFSKYMQTYAIYKTTFDHAIFDVYISLDGNGKINGFQVKPHIASAKLSRNKSILQIPFIDHWTVIWGGDTEKENYHVVNQSQKHAFDLLIHDGNGKSYQNDGRQNSDYYAFGKDLFSPVNGIVVLVVDGIKDNNPGEMNPMFATGNTVIIKTEYDEYLVFAHFKQNSIKVKQDQHIKAGELLGKVGNSGNSSEAHIHFHIQDGEHLTNSVGVKAFFETLNVNGKKISDYSPVKGDVISAN